nr:hypothetical protein [Nanoarchaeum sp.]
MAIKYSILVGKPNKLTEEDRLALTVKGYRFSKKGLNANGQHYFVCEQISVFEQISRVPNDYQNGRITGIREKTIHGIVQDGLDGLLEVNLTIPEQKDL